VLVLVGVWECLRHTATGCDIHVQPRYVVAAMDAFAACYRLGAVARDTDA
jgi:hypothetical protein